MKDWHKNKKSAPPEGAALSLHAPAGANPPAAPGGAYMFG